MRFTRNNHPRGGGHLHTNRLLAEEIGAALPRTLIPVDPRELNDVHPRLSPGQVRFKLAIRALRHRLGMGQQKFGVWLGLTSGSAKSVVPCWESVRDVRLPSLGYVQQIREKLEEIDR